MNFQDQLIAPAVGLVVFVIGVAFLTSHVRSWKLQKHDSGLSDDDREFFYKRFRRRMQNSGMIAAIGILLAVGDMLPILQQRPLLFGVYWCTVLLLVFWVIGLGVTDLLASTAHSRVALARVHQKQRELEEQLQQMRRSRSNGHGSPERSGREPLQN